MITTASAITEKQTKKEIEELKEKLNDPQLDEIEKDVIKLEIETLENLHCY